MSSIDRYHFATDEKLHLEWWGALVSRGVKMVLILPVIEPRSCDGCGLCCEGIGSPVLLYASRPGWDDHHPFRPALLPQELVDEIDENFAGLMRGQEPQDRCLWFDPETRRCRHYEHRPQVCIDYELAGRACLTRRQVAVMAGEATFEKTPPPRDSVMNDCNSTDI